MCVIMTSKKNSLTKSMMEDGAAANRDGGGVSWVEDGAVRFYKDTDAKKVIDVALDVKGQVMVHFRIGTIGSKTSKLCHPFPIDINVPLFTSGKAGAVLMHNGHWSEWKNHTKIPVLHHKVKFPKGEWSDSRALAFLAAFYGINSLELFEAGKVAVMTKDGIRHFGDWTEEGGNFFSNTGFKRYTPTILCGGGHYQGTGKNNYEKAYCTIAKDWIPKAQHPEYVWDYETQGYVHKSVHEDWVIDANTHTYVFKKKTKEEIQTTLDEAAQEDDAKGFCTQCHGTGQVAEMGYRGMMGECYGCNGTGLRTEELRLDALAASDIVAT